MKIKKIPVYIKNTPMALLTYVLFKVYWEKRIDRAMQRLIEQNPDVKKWEFWHGWMGLNPLLVANMQTFKLTFRKHKQ